MQLLRHYYFFLSSITVYSFTISYASVLYAMTLASESGALLTELLRQLRWLRAFIPQLRSFPGATFHVPTTTVQYTKEVIVCITLSMLSARSDELFSKRCMER